MELMIVGDVHGKSRQFTNIVNDFLQKDTEGKYVVQLGDLGFQYDYLKMWSVDNLGCIAGNHDNYTKNSEGKFIKQTPHFLGDFGLLPVSCGGYGGSPPFFFRGELSIDYKYRTQNIDWWPDEQLSYSQMNQCIDKYEKVKPDFVISHGAPASIIPLVSTYPQHTLATRFGIGQHEIPSQTAKMAQTMLEIHKPKLWVFGHYHNSFDQVIDGTNFVCLNELQVFTLNH